MPTSFGHAQGLPSLIIFYDLWNEAYSRKVCDVFTEGSHHRNLSVILITQNLFHQGRHCRDITQCQISGFTKNVRDKNQFLYLAKQAYPENPECLYKAYLEATDGPPQLLYTGLCSRHFVTR
jgi:hypothetical protein